MGFEIITSTEDCLGFILSIYNAKEIAIDTETSSLDTFTCKPYILSVCIDEDIFVFDLLKFTDLKYIINLIKDKPIVGHNLNFDLKVIYSATGILLTNVYDTMIAEVLIHQGIGKKFYSLEELVLDYCFIYIDKEVRKSFYANGDLTELTESQLIYAGEDVKYLSDIKKRQQKKIAEQGQDKTVNLEMRTVPVVADMELNGIILDTIKWKALMEIAKEKAQESKLLFLNLIIDKLDLSKYANLLDVCNALRIRITTKRDQNLLQQISDVTHYRDYVINNLNTGSWKQMLNVFNMIGINIKSTGEDVLLEFVRKSKKEKFTVLINHLLDFRGYFKKATSFGQGFLDCIRKETGRLHYSLNQTVAESGRFSISEPAMQQILRDSEYRDCFIASDGFVFICSDYSQQELRVAGSVSEEPKFIDAFKNGVDMHALTASILFDKPITEVTKDERSLAKSFNFATLYGSTEYGLAFNFDLELERAKDMLDKFLKGYPVLAKFKAQAEDQIIKKKFSNTMNGRKRFFEIPSIYEDVRKYERSISRIKREGFNHIIQGTGADIMKIALCNIFYNNPYGKDLRIVLTVHDEIIVEVVEKIAEEAQKFVISCMLVAEQPFLYGIDAAVDSKIAKVWAK